MLYIRFPLSLRNVEDLLHERSVEISHETVRFWWLRFGPMFAAEIRKRRIEGMRSSRWRWHLDEIFVKINGETHYLWRAVDHEGRGLESFVTKKRDKKAALKLLKKALRNHGRSEVFVTDELRSHGAALKEIGAADRQETGRWLNNLAENSHRPFRRRERAMLRFRGMRSSPPSLPPSTTISTRNAATRAGTHSTPTAPPLSPSGAVSARINGQPSCPG